MPEGKTIDIRELKQDDRNLNLGTPEGEKLIKESIEEDGLGRSILIDNQGKIIAGNKTTKGAIANGVQKVRIIETDGTELIAVKRTDLDLDTDAQARRMAFRDNATAQSNLNWDIEQVEAQSEEFDFSIEEFNITETHSEERQGANDGGDGTHANGGEGIERKSLAERFIIPPFSVFDTRKGYWQKRKRQWLAIGIQSELGRGGDDVQRPPMAIGEIREGSSSFEYATSYKNQDKLMSYFKKK